MAGSSRSKNNGVSVVARDRFDLDLEHGFGKTFFRVKVKYFSYQINCLTQKLSGEAQGTHTIEF